MDFDLTDEQRMFRDTLREFVEKEIVPVASEWEREDRYPTEIVETMKELGLFGITIPEEYGGLGIDMVSFTLVFEEIAKGWMGVAGILGSHSLRRG
jgi:alkylation response protein AidB-like acyl-CoA dehydrogenase